MQLTVFGASGRTGSCLVAQALERGHRVTAYVRNANSLPQHPQLDVVVGDIGSSADVERVVNGQDVVLMALGAKRDSRDHVRTRGTTTIVPAMQKFGVKRLINVAGIDSGESRGRLGRIGKPGSLGAGTTFRILEAYPACTAHGCSHQVLVNIDERWIQKKCDYFLVNILSIFIRNGDRKGKITWN